MPSGNSIAKSVYDQNRERILKNYEILQGRNLESTTPTWGAGFTDSTGRGLSGGLRNVFEAPGVAAAKGWDAAGRGVGALGSILGRGLNSARDTATAAGQGAYEGLRGISPAILRALVGEKGVQELDDSFASRFYGMKSASEPSRGGAYLASALGGGLGGGLYSGAKRDSVGNGLMAMLLALAAGGGAKSLARRGTQGLAHRLEPRLAEELATKVRNVTPGMPGIARRIHKAAPAVGIGAGIAAGGETAYQMAQPPSLLELAKSKVGL
jgi:hypothetical protein